MMVTVALNLQQTTTVAHHPIIAQRTLRFQAEDFLQPPQTWFATMKIFFRGCGPAVALVVLRQIGFPKKLIGRLIAAYVLAAQFLDQPVLMRAMIALHSAFGLRRAGPIIRMPSLAHMRPNCVSGACPACFSASLAGRT